MSLHNEKNYTKLRKTIFFELTILDNAGAEHGLFGIGELVLVLVEHGQLRVPVHAQPVLGVVDGDEVRDELVVGLADDAPLPLFRPEDGVVVQRVVHHRESYKPTKLLFFEI